jgi:hypothetical protein
VYAEQDKKRLQDANPRKKRHGKSQIWSNSTRIVTLTKNACKMKICSISFSSFARSENYGSKRLGDWQSPNDDSQISCEGEQLLYRVEVTTTKFISAIKGKLIS